MNRIDWNNRLIGIKGARGAGKTTLLLQYAKEFLPKDNQTLYVSLDDLYFTENSLVDFAEQFVLQGGKYLLLDEVHRYQNWSQELKNIYDDHPDLKVVFTGSSLIHLNQAKGDLSRRAVMYELTGLSFREYLNFTQGIALDPIDFDTLINFHTDFALKISARMRPLSHFQEYLEYGYYPYFKEAPNLYHQKLSETISLALSIDLPFSHDISFSSVEKIRLLLHVISKSVPFKPNISKLSERIGINRNSLVQFIRYLDDMRVINCLYVNTNTISALQKPEKIYMHHPNLQYALASENTNIGNVRESFFINQLGTLGPVNYAPEGDFIFKDYVFEIGGRRKTNKQVKHLKKSFVVADNIEVGHLHKIPLWVFGFMY
ncbi:MAG: ATP-binding protein [Bacteroidota bacterium]